MKVNAISFGMRSRYSSNMAKFSGQDKKQNPYSQNPSIELKKVPVAILIAMSPLAVPAQAQEVQDSTVQNSEIYQDNPVKCIGKKEITTANGKEFCRFLFYNTDGNQKDAELMGFNYNCYTKDGNIGVVDGVFQAICPERTKDGSYLTAFEEIINSENTGIVKPCLVSGEFGDYIMKFATLKDNNHAVEIAGKEDFEKAFGKSTIEKSGNMSDYVSTIVYPED